MMSTTTAGRGHDSACDRPACALDRRLHSLGHEALRVWDDHAILLGDQEPAGTSFHSGRPAGTVMHASEIGPLNGGEHRQFFR